MYEQTHDAKFVDWASKLIYYYHFKVFCMKNPYGIQSLDRLHNRHALDQALLIHDS
jgi:hypothetical protein